jgi:hypothetical protein
MYRDAERNNRPTDKIVWSGTMRTGDVMHIPRGYWHQATRAEHGSGYSLHATFGFVKRTGVDWLTWVADQSRQQEVFRHDLDRWGNPADQVEQARRLLATLPDLIADHSQETYLVAREQERPSRRHVITSGAFGPPTDVVCVTDFPPHVEMNGDTVDVVAAGKVIKFAAKAEPALRLLLSGNPVNIEQATATTGLNTDVLANALLDRGICAELTNDLASGYTGLVEPDHQIP